MSIKNNATRILEKNNITYVAHEYTTEKLSAIEIADLIGFPHARVFKTIVTLRSGRGKPILAIVPGNAEVDMKALAKAMGEKKVTLAKHAEAEKITKLQTGGISPLALLNKPFDTIIDQTALDYTTICVSGGQRGLNIELSPNDLIELVKASTGQFIR